MIYSLACATYLIGSRINKVNKDWLKNIEKNCGEEILYEAKDPELQTFEKFNMAFSLVGVYAGIIIE